MTTGKNSLEYTPRRGPLAADVSTVAGTVWRSSWGILCVRFLAVGLIFGLLGGFAAAEPPQEGLTVRASVVRVLDGDTIEVELRRVVRVRLLDCWTPELHGAEKTRAELAKRHCERLAKNTHGILFIPTDNARQIGDVTTLGRVLGHYWPDDSDQSLSELMVSSGYARRTKPK